MESKILFRHSKSIKKNYSNFFSFYILRRHSHQQYSYTHQLHKYENNFQTKNYQMGTSFNNIPSQCLLQNHYFTNIPKDQATNLKRVKNLSDIYILLGVLFLNLHFTDLGPYFYFIILWNLPFSIFLAELAGQGMHPGIKDHEVNILVGLTYLLSDFLFFFF